jgi:hypothetical protein
MQRFSYCLNVILAVGLFLVVFRCGCKPEYKDKPLVIEIADSNAMYDQLENQYSNQMLKLYDSIEYLNKHVKTAKTIYKTKIVQVWADSVISTDECSDIINQANIIILGQDSLIGIQVRSLDACSSQVTNLRKQVEHNIDLKTEYQNLYKETATENTKLEKKILRLKKSRILLFGLGLISGLSVVFVK